MDLHVKNRTREVLTPFVCRKETKEAKEKKGDCTPDGNAQRWLEGKRIFTEAKIGHGEAENSETEEDADDAEASDRLRRQVLVVEGVLGVLAQRLLTSARRRGQALQLDDVYLLHDQSYTMVKSSNES